MGQRARHHYVPNLLLKRFAATRRGDTALLFRCSRQGVTPASTRDVAVEKHFHGSESDGLESAFEKAETRWGKLLVRLDEGLAPASVADELWDFLYLIGWRVNAVRSAATLLVDDFFEVLPSAEGAALMQERMARDLDSMWDEALEKAFRDLPDQFRPIVPFFRANPELLRQYIEAELPKLNLQPLLAAFVEGAIQGGAMQAAAKRGHNEGMAKLLSQGHAPKAGAPQSWAILRDPAACLVLGDSPVIAVGPTLDDIGMPWKFGKEVRTLYLPLSPNCVLVARHDLSQPLLSLAALNAASVSLSEVAFFSSRATDEEHRLCRLIGTKWMPMDNQEIRAMVRTAIRGEPT